MTLSNNQLHRLALAFLAARAPAAYPLRAIAQRIGTSGLTDGPVDPEDVEVSLRQMALREGWVNVEIDPVTKTAGWFATDAGVAQWNLDGRLVVE
jgi:hypothetical protein